MHVLPPIDPGPEARPDGVSEVDHARDAAESAIREVRAMRRALDEHALLSVADRNGRIIDVNTGFCQISGYSREELLGQDHRILNSREHPRTFWIEMWRTITSGRAWRSEVCNRRKDGTLYWVDSTVVPLLDPTGRIERFVSIRFDITDKKATQSELEAASLRLLETNTILEQATAHANDMAAQAEMASYAKSEFLANMSHEIRTPLTAILGYTDVLRDELAVAVGSARQLDAVDTIRRAGEHLLTVINDILDLSKIEAGRMVIEEIDTSLTTLLLEVDGLMQERVAAKGVTLRTSLATPVPDRICTDPTRLRQILMNIVGNAIKFTEVGTVDVVVRAVPASDPFSSDRLEVSVTDTGAGMTKRQAEGLFQPFTQADASVTRRHGGTGLGLTICRRLAALMEGDVRLHSTRPGVGSTFVLDLPLVASEQATLVQALRTDAAPASASAAPAAAITLQGRILLAEDGPDNQRLISHHLRKAGAEVVIAENGAVALQHMLAGIDDGAPFDLLVTDMQMPEMDGYTLARTLRARGVRTPIVALTAHAMAEDRAKCLAAGCDDYASKPIDRTALLATCAHWLSHGERTLDEMVFPALSLPFEDGDAFEADHAEESSPEPPSFHVDDTMLDTVEGVPSLILSDLADDPDLAELIRTFTYNLGSRMEQLTACVEGGDLAGVARLAHQLKGTGTSYGFPSLTRAARAVEALAVDAADATALADALTTLLATARAIRRGASATPHLAIPAIRDLP
jgi:PAS domain S-box-containing protein